MIEIPIGAKLKIGNELCEVVIGKSCANCQIQKYTSSRTINGMSMKCGTKYNGNTSDFACSKDDRDDSQNIVFKKLNK